jgi:NAD(P)-dependent dehydrogenase (short-subunit alcohol dehydrogenase family)
MRYHNKAVIVTGGSKGIGEGCARVFCREGGLVSILARGREAGERLAGELSATGPGQAIYLPCDVAQPDQLMSAIDQTVKEFGRLDCIVNNAGWHPPATRIDDATLDDLESLLRLNFISTFVGCKHALPHLRKTKGTIVNMASMVGILGQDQAAAYCSTKAAQIGLTKALAVELGPEGIRVNAILPGNVDTPLMHEWAATLADHGHLGGNRPHRPVPRHGRLQLPHRPGDRSRRRRESGLLRRRSCCAYAPFHPACHCNAVGGSA